MNRRRELDRLVALAGHGSRQALHGRAAAGHIVLDGEAIRRRLYCAVVKLKTPVPSASDHALQDPELNRVGLMHP